MPETAGQPVLLMVSGGSDSEAMLEMAVAGAVGTGDEAFSVLHVNHMLRGAASDADEVFVVERCAELGVPCSVARVDVAALSAAGRNSMEAVARERRYELADAELDRICISSGVPADRGRIWTAHTLDDRIETFFMRTLVGTGPGGLASIPRKRGRIRRPLLDSTREKLRDWLRAEHPGVPDELLWREDATNDDGSNFRSEVRHDLMPVLRRLRPGFERPLAQTMDLIAEEDGELQTQAAAAVYRNLDWDGEEAVVPARLLADLPRSMSRRVLRQCLLVVAPQARLEAAQIDRILDHVGDAAYTTETSGGIRVKAAGGKLRMRKVQ